MLAGMAILNLALGFVPESIHSILGWHFYKPSPLGSRAWVQLNISNVCLVLGFYPVARWSLQSTCLHGVLWQTEPDQGSLSGL